jgi:hypothetical protein
MIERKQHVLAVIPCDFGKSTIIMMLAKMYDPHLITVAILPLSGLQRDFHQRAVEHGIRITEYDPAHHELTQGGSGQSSRDLGQEGSVGRQAGKKKMDLSVSWSERLQIASRYCQKVSEANFIPHKP